MPDWGIASDYEFTDDLTNEGWAWEYLRRNTDYQNDIYALEQLINEINIELDCNVLDSGERTLDTIKRAWHFETPIYRNETIADWKTRCIRNYLEPKRTVIWKWVAEKWGMKNFVYSSDYDEPPEFLPYSPHPKLLRHSDQLINYYHGPDEGNQLINNFAVIAFDLSQPLLQQTKEAESIIKKYQKELDITLGRNYINRAKNPAYLYLLDAFSAEIGIDEIGSSPMYNFRIDDASTDYNRRRRIRANHKSAIKLTKTYQEFLKPQS